MRPRVRLSALAVLAAAVLAAGWSQSDPAELLTAGARLQRQGRLDEAIAVYEKAAALKPDSFEAQLALSKMLDLRFTYDQAREHLGKAIELAGGDERPVALAAMGVSFAFERKPADAAKYYQRVFDLQNGAKDQNGAAETADALGRVYLECGDAANARQWYETGYETARRQRDLPGPLLDLWQLRWEHAQARIAARQGDWPAASRHLAAVKALAAKRGAGSTAWPLYYALQGYVDFYARHDRAAIEALLKADQADAFVLAMLGQAYERVHDVTRAREAYARVMPILHHDLQVAFGRPIAAGRLKALSTDSGVR